MKSSTLRHILATVAASLLTLVLAIGTAVAIAPDAAHADDAPAKHATTIDVSMHSSVVVGSTPTAWITVTGAGNIVPTGLVTMTILDHEYTARLIMPASSNQMVAEINLQPLNKVGIWDVVVSYLGDDNHRGSGPITSSLTITPASLVATVDVPAINYVGEEITLTANFSTSYPLTSGMGVQFSIGERIYSTTLAPYPGGLRHYATLTYTPTEPATVTASATLPGAYNHIVTPVISSFEVRSRPTTIAVTASADGPIAALTATVTSPAREVTPIPSGRVDFYAGDDLIASGTPDATGTVATVSSPLPGGNHTITARFSDVSQRFAPSTSGPVPLSIGTITPSPEPTAEPTPEPTATTEPAPEPTATPTPEPTATPSSAPIAVPTSTTAPSTAPESMPATTQPTASEVAQTTTPTVAATPAALAATGSNGLGLGLFGIAAALLIAGTVLRRRRA